MRLIVFSDIHIDARTAGVERIDEVRGFFGTMVDDAERDPVDWFICLGDCFDPGRQDIRYATALIEMAMHLHAVARVGTIWVAGNHDVMHRSDGLTTLSPLRAAAGGISRIGGGLMYVIERPELVVLRYGIGPSPRFLGLPWPAQVGSEDYADALSEAMEAARGTSAAGCDVVVGAHLSVTGARLGSESYEMARGGDVALPAAELLAMRPALVMNGHYHEPQVVDVGGLEVHIPGSPLRLTFGDRGHGGKGYMVVEL